MVQAQKNRDKQVLEQKFINQFGRLGLLDRREATSKLVRRENQLAWVRRGLRSLDLGHQVRPAAQKEAEYIYKSPLP